MITGFNTDIEYNGVVYHVQTEDKGLGSPLILSLVYTGGEILASKRSPYEDLIAAGFDEALLAERVKRQHRLICAAINAGRIDDLKRMSGRGTDRGAPPTAEILTPDQEFEAPASPSPVTETPAEESLFVSNASDFEDLTQEIPPSSAPIEATQPEPEETHGEVVPQPPPIEPSAYTVHDSRRQSPLGSPSPDKGVVITLLEEKEFRAGQVYNIRVLVENRSGGKGKPLGSVPLSVKILGTAFRPQLYSVKTGRDGVAVISVQIPRFTSGRAAILFRADADGKAIETRRVIHAAL